ncbi:aminotransferase [Oceanicella actignis]|uniref:aminotransferase n=1 Tax=Oceanicella actignis TaxID=1189325 RepID=UPI0011E609B0|nr:aminotransferase [Oceanicella actignis]TYO89981.1 aspartate/methionine/tyrosine aminotransferase [Oceanicella actignis]
MTQPASPSAPVRAPAPGASLNPLLAAVAPSPVVEARRWIAGRVFAPERPLLNLSQAAPADPPPPELRAAIAEALDQPRAHVYGPVLGLPELREAVAERWSEDYAARISADEVAIAAGCNQAFCAAMATLAGPGDAAILPTPWYFNHRMWLEMSGVRVLPLPCGPDMLPDPEAAARLLEAEPRVRAIVLVTPNNPTGAECPPELVARFFDVARARGAALVLDETYRDFRAAEGPAHGLFARPDWREGLIHLYSFSKVFRLTGHRVGAMIAAPERLREAEKFLDTVAICPPAIGQIAALEGLRRLRAWTRGERAATLARRAALEEAAPRLAPGWQVLSAGAYFAWLRHPFAESSADLARRMVEEAAVLMLPGTMFHPEGDPAGRATLRMAFANADEDGVREALARLGRMGPPREGG